MFNNLKKIILILPFITMLSCSESHIFSDKKNLNTALNDLFKGDFYSCNLIDDNDLENKKNSNTTVNLIYTPVLEKGNSCSSMYIFHCLPTMLY